MGTQNRKSHSENSKSSLPSSARTSSKLMPRSARGSGLSFVDAIPRAGRGALRAGAFAALLMTGASGFLGIAEGAAGLVRGTTLEGGSLLVVVGRIVQGNAGLRTTGREMVRDAAADGTTVEREEGSTRDETAGLVVLIGRADDGAREDGMVRAGGAAANIGSSTSERLAIYSRFDETPTWESKASSLLQAIFKHNVICIVGKLRIGARGSCATNSSEICVLEWRFVGQLCDD